MGISAALEMDALVPSFIFLMFASDVTNRLEKAPRNQTETLFFVAHMRNMSLRAEI